MTTYANRQNAIRAARKALGAHAKPGEQFLLTEAAEGFSWTPAAASVPAQPAPAAELPAPSPAPAAAAPTYEPGSLDAIVADLARVHFGRETIEQRYSDGLDFFEVGIVTLRNALEAAYSAGHAAGHAQGAAEARSVAKPARRSREVNKRELVAKMLTAPEGTTAADIMVACNWPSVSVPQQARASGLALRVEREKGKATRYYGTPAEA